MKIAYTTLFAALCLAGCKGGSYPRPTTEIVEDRPSIGRFVDSEVGGLWYESPSYSGYTTENGEFNYKEGEETSFFLGKTLLGTAKNSILITPFDLIKDGDNVDKIQNILTLLQSLDIDSNPDNGIIISEQTNEYLSQFNIDINTPKEIFSATDAVQKIALAQTNSGELVNAYDALVHFRKTLLSESRQENEEIVLNLMGTHWQSSLATPECGDIELYQLNFTIIGPVSLGAHSYDKTTCEPTRLAILGSTYELNSFWACGTECTNSDLNRVVETKNGTALLQYINGQLSISEERQDNVTLKMTFTKLEQ